MIDITSGVKELIFMGDFGFKKRSEQLPKWKPESVLISDARLGA
jgi:hypothetical protein